MFDHSVVYKWRNHAQHVSLTSFFSKRTNTKSRRQSIPRPSANAAVNNIQFLFFDGKSFVYWLGIARRSPNIMYHSIWVRIKFIARSRSLHTTGKERKNRCNRIKRSYNSLNILAFIAPRTLWDGLSRAVIQSKVKERERERNIFCYFILRPDWPR